MAEARSSTLTGRPPRKRSPRVPAAEVILDAGNPFPGPKPYFRDQRELFFGRGHETKELTSLVLSTSAVLLYAQSGSGKSSLLQAGLVPSLEKFGYRILPTVRFGRIDPAQVDSRPDTLSPNPFAKLVCDTVFATSDSPEPGLDLEQLAAQLAEQDGKKPTLLILDQLEELFASPAFWQERGEFLAQLRRALDGNSWLRAVLAIRSDSLASLLPYERELPGRVLIRYELESLRAQAARDAIEQTFRSTGVPLAASELDSILDRLLTLDSGPPGARGQYVNLIQLQILCRRLWWEKSRPALPAGPGAPDGSRALQDSEVNLAVYMQSFVDDAVAAVVTQTQADEGVVRLWLQERLTTSNGRRAVLLVENEETAGLPQNVLDALENARLIQVEQRNQLRWAELTHDSMVAAVRAANETWTKVRRRSRLRVTAILAVVLAVLLTSFVFFRLPSNSTLLASASGIDTRSQLAVPFPAAPPGQVASVSAVLSGRVAAGGTVRLVARVSGKNQDKTLASSAIPVLADGNVSTVVHLVAPTVPSASYSVVVAAPGMSASTGDHFLNYTVTVNAAPVILDIRRPGVVVTGQVNTLLVAVKLYAGKPLYLRTQLDYLQTVYDAQTLVSNYGEQQVVIESPGGDGYAVLAFSTPFVQGTPGQLKGQLATPGPTLQTGSKGQVPAAPAVVSSVRADGGQVPFAVDTSCQNGTAASMALMTSPARSVGSAAQSVPSTSVLVSAAQGTEYHLIMLTGQPGGTNLDCSVDIRSFAQQQITATSVRQITIPANSRFNAYLVRLPANAAMIVTNLNGAPASLDCLTGSITESDTNRLLAFAQKDHDCVLSVARSSTPMRQPVSFPLLIVPVSGV